VRRSECEDVIRSWTDHGVKIFKYRRELAPNEYISFRKINLGPSTEEQFFEAEKENSTYVLPRMDYEAFIKLMMLEELIYEKDWTWSTDVRKMKTGGCTCGAWVLKDNTYLHHPTCANHRRGW